MSEGAVPIKKMIPIIVITWILSLVTTLAVVYVAPNIFPIRVTTENIADSAIITIKLADGNVTSAKILDGTLTAEDIADGSIITVKVADGAVTTSKIADVAVTNNKLAAGVIPFNSAYSGTRASTTSTWFEDMPDMSVNITLERTSHLLMLFSCDAYQSSSTAEIRIRALVGTNIARPEEVILFSYHHQLTYSAYTYNFYLPDITAGTYTVKIQWSVSSAVGVVLYRTLTVIALPA